MNFLQFVKVVMERDKGKENNNYDNYMKFQAFQGEEVIKDLKKRGVDIKKSKVLELAVGIGGYSPIIYKNCKKLIINDIRNPKILEKYPEIEFSKFDVREKYPFPDETFDIVFAMSLIEHIDKPDAMLSEIKRVLKKGGYLYLTFPPFYSPVGGHRFKPFHLLGEKIAVKMTNLLQKEHYESYATMYKRDYGTYGLHKRTIRGVKKMLKKKFIVQDYWARFMSINTAKIPLFRELITWHVDFLCRKR
jgi:ubiquinone/menaquinone biosynthesis C-methylase UbiE